MSQHHCKVHEVRSAAHFRVTDCVAQDLWDTTGQANWFTILKIKIDP